MKGSWRKSKVDEAIARKSEFHAAAEPATYTLTYLIPFTTHTAYVAEIMTCLSMRVEALSIHSRYTSDVGFILRSQVLSRDSLLALF